MTTGTYSKPLNDETYADVLEATRTWTLDYLREHGTFVEAWRVDSGAATLFGHDGHFHPGEKFGNQVRRALNRLADEGVLVKIGRGDRHPDGSYVTNPVYYTPETHEKAIEQAEQNAEAAREAEVRWAAVRQVLKDHDIPFTTHNPHAVYDNDESENGQPFLRLSAWERLVAMTLRPTAGA